MDINDRLTMDEIGYRQNLIERVSIKLVNLIRIHKYFSLEWENHLKDKKYESKTCEYIKAVLKDLNETLTVLDTPFDIEEIFNLSLTDIIIKYQQVVSVKSTEITNMLLATLAFQ
jgi:hypothetical protein